MEKQHIILLRIFPI